MIKKDKQTSWGKVAKWYDDLTGDPNSYQRQIILPNLWRLLDPQPGQKILDLACGSGFFARELAKAGAEVVGVDISPELINLAKKAPGSEQINYFISPAHDLSMLARQSQDLVINVLAIQNIAEVKEMLAEVKRVLKHGGRLLVVMNHPVLRIPQGSSWGWDQGTGIQYRRLDWYLSESQTKIKMHPGAEPEVDTISFHRPLQFYFKLLTNSGFVISRLEEWISPKTSQPGPRAAAEDRARKEFPLFLCLEACLV